MRLVYCPECLEKQRRIDELEEENGRLKAQLRYQQRKATDGAGRRRRQQADQPCTHQRQEDNKRQDPVVKPRHR